MSDIEAHLTTHPDDNEAAVGFVASTDDLEAARRLFQRLLKKIPQATAPRFGMAAIGRTTGNLVVAERAALSILRHDPDNRAILAYLPDDAARRISQLATTARAIDALVARAKAGEVDAALDALRELALSDENAPRAAVEHQQICAMTGRTDQARALVAALPGDRPRTAVERIATARALVAGGAADEALEHGWQGIVARAELPDARLLVQELGEVSDSVRDRLRDLLVEHQDDAPNPASLAMLVTSLGPTSTGAALPDAEEGASFLRDAEMKAQAGDSNGAARAWIGWAGARPSYARYLRAAREAEALHEWGAVEYLYNHAIRFNRLGTEARQGLERLRADSQRRTPQPAPESDYLQLAERLAASGDVDGAVGHLVTWAEREGRAESFADAGRRAEELGRGAVARHLYGRAIALDEHNTAAIEGAARLEPEAVQLRRIVDALPRSLETGLRLARGLATRTRSAEIVFGLDAALARHGLTRTSWVPPGSIAAVVCEWLAGTRTTDDTVAAGAPADELARIAACLALSAGRWSEAVDALDASESAARVVTVYHRDGFPGAMDGPRSIERARGLLDGLATQLPDVRRLGATSNKAFRTAMSRAWSAWSDGDLAEAAFAYASAAEAPDPNAWVASVNAGIILARAGRHGEALPHLARARKRAPRDNGLIWAEALSCWTVRDGRRAEKLLHELVSHEPTHRNARLALVALAVLGYRAAPSVKDLVGPGAAAWLLAEPADVAQLLIELTLTREDRLFVGRTLREMGHILGGSDLAGAEAAEDEIADLRPDNRRTLQELQRMARSMISKGEALKADRFLLACLDPDPLGARDTRLLRARVWGTRGLVGPALTALEELRRGLDPVVAAPNYHVEAEIRADIGAAAEAFEILTTHVEPHMPVAPELRSALRRAGISLPETAEEAAKRLPRFPDKFTPAWLAEFEAGAAGIEALAAERLLKANLGRYVPAHLLLGRLLVRAGKVQRAERAFLDAIAFALPHTVANAAEQALRTLVETGNARATEHLLSTIPHHAFTSAALAAAIDDAAAQDPTGKVALRWARLLHELGRQGEMRQQLNAALQRAGRDEAVVTACKKWAPDLLDRPSAEQVERQMRRFKSQPHRAVELVQHNLANDPNNAGYTRLLAEALEWAGDVEGALVALEALSKRTQARADTLRVGELLGRLGRMDDQADLYLALLEVDPFDEGVRERLVAMDRADLVPFPCSDGRLLALASEVCREGERPNVRRRLFDYMSSLGPGPDVRVVLEVLRKREPNVHYWRIFSEDERRSAPSQPERRPGTGSAAPETGYRAGGDTPGVSAAPAPVAPEGSTTRTAEATEAAPPRMPMLRSATQPASAGLGPLHVPIEKRRSAWNRYRSISDQPQAWVEAVAVVAPQSWTWFKASKTVDHLEPSDLLRDLCTWVREQVRERRVEPPDLVLELAWLFRLRRALLRGDRPTEPRRDDRRRGRGAPRSRESEPRNPADRTLSAEIESDLLPLALKPMRRLEGDALALYSVEVAEVLESTLVEFFRAARGALGLVRELADIYLRLPRLSDRDEHEALLARVERLTADLSKPSERFSQPVRLGLRDVAEQWKEWHRQVVRDALLSANLRVSVGRAEGLGEGTFRVEIELYNDGETAAGGIQLEARADEAMGGTVRLAQPGAIPNIPSAQSIGIELRFEDVPDRVRAFVLAVNVSYRPNERLVHRVATHHVIVPPWAILPRTHRATPYTAGPPVLGGDNSFIPRPELMARVTGALTAPGSRNIVLIHGLRRMGKTTLVKSLLSGLGPDEFGVLIDLQKAGGADVKTPQLYYMWADEISRRLHTAGIALPLPRVEEFEARPTVTLTAFFHACEQALGGRRLLLVFDEFEYLLDGIDRADKFDRGVLGFLRGWMQDAPWMSFVLVGANRVLDMVQSYGTPLFNLMLPIWVSYLSEEQAKELIQRPVRGQLSFDRRAVDLLAAETNGHPFFLQRLCQELLFRMVDRDQVTWWDVEEVTQALVRQWGNDPDLGTMLKGNPEEYRFVLLAVADLCAARRWVAVEEVERRLTELYCPVEDALTVVLRLAQMDLLRTRVRPDHSHECQVAMPLFGRWLRAHGALSGIAAERRMAEIERDLEEA